MPQFNLNDYETVEDRLKRAHTTYPDLRVVTKNRTTPQDRQVSTWVVEARIYLTAEDQAKGLVKATGWAFEIDGAGMANKTSALENCETSAIGRALANMNLSGNKRATREEMQKVERGSKASRNWVAEIEKLETIESARQLYNEARTQKAPTAVLDDIKAKVASFGTLPTT
jgi:hypothetical protein